jgi:nucleotide-binding universal stress UspA family protein
MTTIEPVHTCPRCALRFLQYVELVDHLEHDHPGEPEPLPVAAPAPAGTVLVPVDTDKAPPLAIQVAGRLARQLGLHVRLFAVPGLGTAAETEAYLRARTREIHTAGAPHVSWEVVGRESPAEAILLAAGPGAVDFVCMATRSSHGPVHAVFGSVAETVAARAEVPVLLCGPKVEVPSTEYRRVVACLDGSEPAQLARAVADRLRAALEAELLLVEVQRPGAALTSEVAEGAAVLYDDHPERAIVWFLDSDPGTIAVVGTRGRTGIRALVGGTARGVVAGSHGPVLVVPPHAQVELVLPSPALPAP